MFVVSSGAAASALGTARDARSLVMPPPIGGYAYPPQRRVPVLGVTTGQTTVVARLLTKPYNLHSVPVRAQQLQNVSNNLYTYIANLCQNVSVNISNFSYF